MVRNVPSGFTIYPGDIAGMPIDGLICSNAAVDPNRDITISVGSAAIKDATSGDSWIAILTSPLTKQLDAAWTAGNNAGGLASGTIAANTTYHLFLLFNPSTLAVDACFDISPSGANTPSGWLKRKIMYALTDGSSNIHQFSQNGNRVDWRTESQDFSGAIPNAARQLYATRVPTGDNIEGIYRLFSGTPASSGTTVGIAIVATSPLVNDQAPTWLSFASMQCIYNSSTGLESEQHVTERVITDTSARIGLRAATTIAGSPTWANAPRLGTIGFMIPGRPDSGAAGYAWGNLSGVPANLTAIAAVANQTPFGQALLAATQQSLRVSVIGATDYQVQSTKPTTRSTGAALVAGDVWVRSTDFTSWTFLSGTDWVSTNRQSTSLFVNSFTIPAGSTSVVTSGTVPTTTTTAGAGVLTMPSARKILIDDVTVSYYSTTTPLAASSYTFNLAGRLTTSNLTILTSGAAITSMVGTSWVRREWSPALLVAGSSWSGILLSVTYSIPANATAQPTHTINASHAITFREVI